MKPVGQSVMDNPRADFRLRPADLVRLPAGFLSTLLRHRGPHVHDFVRLARLEGRDVFDCSCGKRKTVAKNGDVLPSTLVLIDAGNYPIDATPFGGRN